MKTPPFRVHRRVFIAFPTPDRLGVNTAGMANLESGKTIGGAKAGPLIFLEFIPDVKAILVGKLRKLRLIGGKLLQSAVTIQLTLGLRLKDSGMFEAGYNNRE